MSTKQNSVFADKKIFGRAVKDSFIKLNPRTQMENPVMFLVFVSAILTSILWLVSLFGMKDAPSGYTLAIAVILWFTVLFANFAEAIAEGRGKAQADSLRASRRMWMPIRFCPQTKRTASRLFPLPRSKRGNW